MCSASGRSYAAVSAKIVLLFLLALIPAHSQVSTSPEPTSDYIYKLNGTVINAATGDPIPHAMVEITDSRKPVAVLTDFSGHFEFDGLPEMQITVNVTKPGFFSEQQLNPNFHPALIQVGPEKPSIILKLVPEAIFFGHVESNDGPAENLPIKIFWPEIINGRRRWQRREARTDDEGNFRSAELSPDTYYIEAGPGVDYTEAALKGLGTAAYFPALFHTGSTEFSGATPVTLAPGQQTEVDFFIKNTAAYTISGRIVGQDSTGGVNLDFRDRFGEPSFFPIRFDPNTRQFSARVPAGSYVLHANAQSLDGKVLNAQVSLAVSGDRNNIEVALAPSPAIPIHVRKDFVSSTTQETMTGGFRFANSQEMQLASVHLLPAGDTLNGHDYWPELGKDADGYAFHNLEPGKYIAEIVANGPWYVESATCGGTDLLRDELDFTGHAEPIEVTLRDGTAGIQGKTRTENRPARGEVLLVRDAAPREIKTVELSEDGSFYLLNLAPGGYSLLALNNLNGIEYRNPEILDKYLSKAEHINLDSQQTLETTIDLTEVEK